MPSRASPSYWLLRFVGGIALLIAAGTGLFRRLLPGDPLGVSTVLPGLFGFYLSLSSITPLVRALALRARTQRIWGEAAHEAFARASLPRRVFYLLAAVAEADGPMSEAERETVRQFVRDRFHDRGAAGDLQLWEAQPLRIDDRVGLAARIAVGLDDTELDSLFCWCCLVAFADDHYREAEHRALQDVARGLGIHPGRARLLFHLTKAQYLRAGDSRRNGQQRRTAQPQHVDPKARALAVLGLPIDAGSDAIRRRHRELVRKFHPDAQRHLGPVAQREATERFHEIQRAYELLAAH